MRGGRDRRLGDGEVGRVIYLLLMVLVGVLAVLGVTVVVGGALAWVASVAVGIVCGLLTLRLVE